jgi:hypothetical protein
MQLRIGLIALWLVAGAGLTFASAPARAQQPLPRGSYQNSCTNMVMADGVLTAACRTADQTVRATSLPNAGACAGGVINANGHLACAPPPLVPVAPFAEPQGLAKFEGRCPGPSHFSIRIRGEPSNVIHFRMDPGEKVHFNLPRSSTYALRCDGPPPSDDVFHLVNFE